MAKASPALTSFNAGELGATLEGRVDIAKYPNGCKELENFIALVQGPIQRRAGSRFVAEVKDSGERVWLRRFEFSATQAFILEFGDRYIRFYTEHGQLLSGGVPYEVATPYALADLTNDEGVFALQIEQSADVLYIAGAGKYSPRTLTRVNTTNWVFDEYKPTNGPFQDQNRTKTLTVYASAQTGSGITVKASSALFSATDVGRLIRIQQQNPDVAPWEPDTPTDITAGDLRRYDGRTYKALNTAKTGTSPPLHDEGTAWDGSGTGIGVEWEFQDAGYGIARITGFTSSTEVTATVVVQLPANVIGSGNATYRWSLGAWSNTSGYPTAVCFAYDRLWWANGIDYWGSVPGLYTDMSADFAGLIAPDCAITGKLTSQDVNKILWMVEAERLIIGTPGGEFALGPITTVDPLGPDNVQVKRQSKKRCRSVPPQTVGTSQVYVQRAGRRLLLMDYDFTRERYTSGNMNALNAQITKSGIIDLAYQAEPNSVLWCVLANGSLIAFTLDQEQDVTAWQRLPIGGNGFVESVECVPDPNGDRDEVWITVKRTINGVTKRYVEFIERPWERGDDQQDVFYVDSGLTYDGPAATTISGLDHLEGETVQIVVGGAAHPDKVVRSGSITLDRSSGGAKVQIGLACPAKAVTMRLEAGSQDGTSQGKVMRITGIVVRLLDTLGGFIGLEGRALTEIKYRRPSMAMDAPPEIFSGDKEQSFDGDYVAGCRVEVRQNQPFPMTIAGLYPSLRAYDQRK